MKLIMENWKRFLTESEEIDKFLETLGLFVSKQDSEYEIFVYKFSKNPFSPIKSPTAKVVGYLSTMEMDKDGGRTPCIPDTQEVGLVAADSTITEKGIGTYMYEVVSYLLKTEQDAGLTSDHGASTSEDAAWVWHRLEKKFNYDKRKTPKGSGEEEINPETGEVAAAYDGENTEFDYHNKTPDPNDDCYLPTEGNPPSNNSLQIPASREGRISRLMKTQSANLERMIDRGLVFVDHNQSSQGDALFNKEYRPGGDKFSDWETLFAKKKKK